MGQPATAVATPGEPPGTTVNLRIEGATRTIFEGQVRTTGHDVTTASGGTHHCDGTNNNTNPIPGPTATSALDDAARQRGFTFDGTFQPQFDDFFITRIADSAQTSTQFWGLLRNFQFTPVGGCQQRVVANDQVLWAFDAFNKAHFLKLTGFPLAVTGRPTTVTVTDAMTGAPIDGAKVDGRTTGADGTVQVTFTLPGLGRLKAERPDSIRSNLLTILVIDPL